MNGMYEWRQARRSGFHGCAYCENANDNGESCAYLVYITLHASFAMTNLGRRGDDGSLLLSFIAFLVR